MRGPTGRRNYKLPRKVIKWMAGTPCPGDGWIFTSRKTEEQMREKAMIADKRQIYGTWVFKGTAYGVGGDWMWLMLNAPDKPEINKWGEVHP